MNAGMKERPMLFNAAMARALAEDRKTVTRRVVKPQPFDLSWSRHDHRFGYVWGRAENGDEVDGFHAYTTRSGGQWSAKCPYGQPGDRLWVRESFVDLLGTGIEHRRTPDGPLQRYAYAADCRPGSFADETRKEMGLKWTPSIHMPRAACRTVLEITSVRIERLQAITRSDIRAEGLECPPELGSDDVSPNYRDWYPAAFRSLWLATGGDWVGNPWVWVVEFKRVLPESASAGVAA